MILVVLAPIVAFVIGGTVGWLAHPFWLRVKESLEEMQ